MGFFLILFLIKNEKLWVRNRSHPEFCGDPYFFSVYLTGPTLKWLFMLFLLSSFSKLLIAQRTFAIIQILQKSFVLFFLFNNINWSIFNLGKYLTNVFSNNT